MEGSFSYTKKKHQIGSKMIQAFHLFIAKMCQLLKHLLCSKGRVRPIITNVTSRLLHGRHGGDLIFFIYYYSHDKIKIQIQSHSHSLYNGRLLFRDADFGVQNLQETAEGGQDIAQVTCS
jgi:ribosomal protein L31